MTAVEAYVKKNNGAKNRTLGDPTSKWGLCVE